MGSITLKFIHTKNENMSYRTSCYTWEKEECHLNICEIRGKEY